MSELLKNAEDVIGGLFGNNHELKPVADPALVAAIKAGEAILTPEHLKEIKGRRAVADLDTLIAACEQFLELLHNYGWSPSVAPEGASEEPAAEEAPAEEPASEPASEDDVKEVTAESAEDQNGADQPTDEAPAEPTQEA